MIYETRNSTYQVDGRWVRATKGGNDLCGTEWKLAKQVTDNGASLIVTFPDGTGFVSSPIVRRVK